MKKNDLLNVYRSLLRHNHRDLLIELGVAAYNAVVQTFVRENQIRRVDLIEASRVCDLSGMVKLFRERFDSARDVGRVHFCRLADRFKRAVGERKDYRFLRRRCEELPAHFDQLRVHRNRIEHERGTPSAVQVRYLSSCIEAVLDLAPPDFSRTKSEAVEALRGECQRAVEISRPVEKRESERKTERTSPPRPGALSVDFPTRVAGPAARVSVRSSEPGPPVEFQIDSVDSSFTTGRQRLDGKRGVDVQLAWHGENRFQVWAFDASGVPFYSHGPFGIVRTEAPPGAFTASRSLLLASPSQDGIGGSAWLVRKGEPLPVERQCVFRISLRGGLERATPSVVVCESNRHEADGGLRPLGRIWLSPDHFPAQRKDAEVEIRCDYRVADPGHLRLNVSVVGAPPESRVARVIAYSQGKVTESPAVELARECQDAFAAAAHEIEIIEDLLQSEGEARDPGPERNSDWTETEELLYGLQIELIEMAREILGIQPSDTLVPLDEWLGAGGNFDFVGPEEERLLMASPEYVTLLKEAATIARTPEFVRDVLPTRGCWSALQFREALGRMNGVRSHLADGPLDRRAFLGCVETGYRALRDADPDLLQEVVKQMSKLLPDSFGRAMVLPTDAERPTPAGAAARWLPLDWKVDDLVVRRKVDEGRNWQCYETSRGRYVLVTRRLADWWVEQGLLEETAFTRMELGDSEYAGMLDEWDWDDEEGHVDGLGPIAQHFAALGQLRLARSIAESRRRTDASFHDAIYSATHERVLPTLSGTPGQTDDVILGCCLTGGFHVPASSLERMTELTTLDEEQIREVLRVSGLPVNAADTTTHVTPPACSTMKSARRPAKFRLPGRPALESFFNEEIIKTARLAERNPAKIEWPGGVVLYGPPGCGKTYAVDRLTEFLGWAVFRIDSGAVGSPYIHETSRKVAKVFEEAREAAPSVIVIDEMEAFLAERASGTSSGQHHLEEVAEFLRRLEEASSHRILVLGMTNRLEFIDPAVVRPGRFDHRVEVEMPSAEEVGSVLREELGDVELAPSVTLEDAADALSGRPLSDAAFLVRWLKRELAKANEDESEWILDNALLAKGIKRLPVPPQKGKRFPIGFRPAAR